MLQCSRQPFPQLPPPALPLSQDLPLFWVTLSPTGPGSAQTPQQEVHGLRDVLPKQHRVQALCYANIYKRRMQIGKVCKISPDPKCQDMGWHIGWESWIPPCPFWGVLLQGALPDSGGLRFCHVGLQLALSKGSPDSPDCPFPYPPA